MKIVDYIKSVEDIEIYLFLFLSIFTIWFIFNTISYYRGQKRKLKNLHKFARRGEIDAQNDLAKYYETGKIVKKSLYNAVFWYQKASFSGDKKARDSLKKFIYKKKKDK